MSEQVESAAEFLVRMADVVQHADYTVTIDHEDLSRLVQMTCLAEARDEVRRQRAFQAFCDSGVKLYEA